MKLNKIMIAAVLAFGASSMMAQAANTGKVHFEGSIAKAACSMDQNSVEQTVKMGQIGDSSLLAGRDSTVKTPFQIKLKDCILPGDKDPAKTMTITFNGIKGAQDDMLQFGPMSSAKNAGVVISYGASTVKLGTPITIGELKAGADTEYTLDFTSHLRGNNDDAKNPIQAGSFFSTANFVVNYN